MAKHTFLLDWEKDSLRRAMYEDKSRNSYLERLFFEAVLASNDLGLKGHKVLSVCFQSPTLSSTPELSFLTEDRADAEIEEIKKRIAADQAALDELTRAKQRPEPKLKGTS